MSLQHGTKPTPRELPPIDLSHTRMTMLGNRSATKKPLKGPKGSGLSREIRIPTATSSSDSVQDPYQTPRTPEVDYIQTDFRYLAIGSPVPEPDIDHEITRTGDPGSPADQQDHDDQVDHRLRSGQKKAGASVYPAIKVDRCEEDAEQTDRRSATPSSPPADGGNARQSGTDDVTNLDSPSAATSPLLLLNPTPPLCRRRVRSKMVTYYQPNLTCSRSEGSIREAVSEDRRRLHDHTGTVDRIPLEADPDSRYGTHSHGSIRSSCCSSPISASNTQDLLSPVTFARQTLIGSFRAASDSKLSHDSSGQRSPVSTPSPSVSPLCSPAARRRPTRLEPLSQGRSVDSGSRLPQI